MSALTRNQTIEQVYGLRGAELRCQAAEASALDEFMSAPDRAAHWNGMVPSGKRLVVVQALDRGGYKVTEEAIALGIAKYEGKYSNEVVTR